MSQRKRSACQEGGSWLLAGRIFHHRGTETQRHREGFGAQRLKPRRRIAGCAARLKACPDTKRLRLQSRNAGKEAFFATDCTEEHTGIPHVSAKNARTWGTGREVASPEGAMFGNIAVVAEFAVTVSDNEAREILI